MIFQGHNQLFGIHLVQVKVSHHNHYRIGHEFIIYSYLRGSVPPELLAITATIYRRNHSSMHRWTCSVQYSPRISNRTKRAAIGVFEIEASSISTISISTNSISITQNSKYRRVIGRVGKIFNDEVRQTIEKWIAFDDLLDAPNCEIIWLSPKYFNIPFGDFQIPRRIKSI